METWIWNSLRISSNYQERQIRNRTFSRGYRVGREIEHERSGRDIVQVLTRVANFTGYLIERGSVIGDGDTSVRARKNGSRCGTPRRAGSPTCRSCW
jgi:hypothetical protein